MSKKLFTVQVRLDIHDLRVLERLVRLKQFGSTRSEVLRLCMHKTDALSRKGNDKDKS